MAARIFSIDEVTSSILVPSTLWFSFADGEDGITRDCGSLIPRSILGLRTALVLLTEDQFSYINGALSEWLRRSTRNRLGFSRASSNLVGSSLFLVPLAKWIRRWSSEPKIACSTHAWDSLFVVLFVEDSNNFLSRG